MKVSETVGSFKDPSGFVFSINGSIYRQINTYYKENYNLLIKSGLYDKLTSLGYLIPHQEVKLAGNRFAKAFKIIQPQKIPFVAYPYEWCFSMLQAAALLTLAIQKVALEYGMSLKDASAFNVQFLRGKPIFIDTLSFEEYAERKPWIAYKQFVEHFLAPLALMSLTDIRLSRLSALFLDGIPVDLAACLLPLRSRFKLSLLLHIHAHAASQKKNSQKKINDRERHSFSKYALLGLIDSLEGAIRGLSWGFRETQWSDYYEKDSNNYNTQSLDQKAQVVRSFIKSTNPQTVWDMGANTGFFSRIAAENGAFVISFDNDYGAMERNFSEIVKNKEENILPLFCDLTNPNPALGWVNEERSSLLERGSTDMILALALIHHLVIAKNIPLTCIASLFSQIGNFLVIEFIPKEDSQVKKLLMNREDIFFDYTKKGFEKAFEKFFKIKRVCPLNSSKRVLYLMEKRKT